MPFRHGEKWHSQVGGRADAVLNFAALCVAGFAGGALLSLIGIAYGPVELGRFNFVFAAYVVASQVAVLAVHHGIIYQLGVLDASDCDARRESLLGGLLAVTASSSIATVFLVALAPIALALADRSDQLSGVLWGIIGAAFFAINKVLLNALTAIERFRMFAAGTSLRGLLLLCSGVGLILAERPGSELPRLLVLGEALLSLVLLLALRRELNEGRVTLRGITSRARWLLRFGIRGSAGGILADLNSRVDILCLSLFVDDLALGIYTLAAILAEAAGQLPLVLRNLLSRRVVGLLASQDAVGIASLVKRTRRMTWPAMLVVGIGILGIHPLASRAVGMNPRDGRVALAVLLIALVIASGYVPFGLIFAQRADAGGHSLLVAATVTVNVMGNLALIPALGINGAAIATGLSSLSSVVLLRMLARMRFGIRI